MKVIDIEYCDLSIIRANVVDHTAEYVGVLYLYNASCEQCVHRKIQNKSSSDAVYFFTDMKGHERYIGYTFITCHATSWVHYGEDIGKS